MRLTVKSEYALLAIIYLAENYEKRLVKIEEIARKQGIPKKYLEQILLNLKRAGYLNSKRGPIATLILNQGKLETSRIIGTSSACGKIKNLEDFQGNQIQEAFPSQPVLILGFEQVPREKTETSIELIKQWNDRIFLVKVLPNS